MKREERAGHFKPSKSSTLTSDFTRKSEPLIHNVTVNVEIMKNVNLNFKPVRGKIWSQSCNASDFYEIWHSEQMEDTYYEYINWNR